MRKAALISPCGKYRYNLTREWDESLPRVTFVMLNPSTADADNDDRTIKKCIKFAKSWGFGSLAVVNLFAFRATKPDDMFRAYRDEATDIVGPDNDGYIRTAIERCTKVVIAWGGNGHVLDRAEQVSRFIPIAYCIETSGHGFPKHPLYMLDNSNPKLVAYNDKLRKFIIPASEHQRPLPASLIVSEGAMHVEVD